MKKIIVVFLVTFVSFGASLVHAADYIYTSIPQTATTSFATYGGGGFSGEAQTYHFSCPSQLVEGLHDLTTYSDWNVSALGGGEFSVTFPSDADASQTPSNGFHTIAFTDNRGDAFSCGPSVDFSTFGPAGGVSMIGVKNLLGAGTSWLLILLVVFLLAVLFIAYRWFKKRRASKI